MDYDTNPVVLKNPSWWKRRSHLERRLLLVTLVFFIIAVISLFGVFLVITRSERYTLDSLGNIRPLEPIRECINCFKEAGPVCLTSGCIHAASTIRKYMDSSVNPCENFYQYACGGFMNETNLPGDVFTITDNLVQEQIRKIVAEAPDQKDIKPYYLVRKLYGMCMDTAKIESDGIGMLKYILQQLGGWPALEHLNWDEQIFDWRHSVFRFREAGFSVDYFLSMDVMIDPGNSSQYLLMVDQADLGLEHEILAKGLDDERVQAYYAYMIDVAALLGADVTYASNELKASLELEIALAKISISKRDIWNASILYNPMTVNELQQRYPDVDWLEYINGVVHLPEYQASYQDLVIVRVPKYLAELLNLLRWTPKRVQANYVLWRAVKFSVGFLTEELRNRQLHFYKSVTKFAERKPRWQECVEVVSLRLRLATGSLYVHKYIQDDTMDALTEMVNNIRNQFYDLIRRSEWMDEFTMNIAIEKAQEVEIHAAYSEELLSLQKLQYYYAPLDYGRGNYFSSILNISSFDMDKYFRKLRTTASNSDLNADVYTTTVFPDYQASKNSVELPSGILQGIFFGTDRPQYMNYGALGYIIGHEFAHAFDDTGRQYDKDGNLLDWWTQHTKREFSKHALCVTHQYRNYTVPEVELFANALETHEDNIANHAGLKAAYLSYMMWTERYGQEYYLPSLGYFTPQQIFWISAAQTHCSKYQPDFLRREGFSENRTPAFYKVHEAFSNSEYFAKDFQCHIGTPMNPLNKCHIW